jgi:hypothetical protein
VRKLLLFVVSSVFVATSAEAVPISVNCPGSPSSTDREFTLTTDPGTATCLDSGDGSNELNGNSADVVLAAGWTLIDKDDIFSTDNWFTIALGAVSGSFTIDAAAWTAWDEIAIGFKVGGGQISPKWAVFQLPDGVTSGSWENDPERGGELSHALLYGMDANTPTEVVPEPATLVLFGSGIMALAARRRRARR